MSISSFRAWAGVSRSFTYAEIAAGRLRATKLGRSTRILVEDAEQWLKSRPPVKLKKPKDNEPVSQDSDDIAA